MSAKLTRAEACAELARLLGWTLHEDSRLSGIATRFILCPPNDTPANFPAWNTARQAWIHGSPKFFASRDAAAELVEWLDKAEPAKACKMIIALGWVGSMAPVELAVHMLTRTPEQITLAACAALGLEVEDAKNENE